MPRSAEEWERAQELFNEVVDLPPEERMTFLDRICGEDDSLRREVESLLASDAEASQFIEEPLLALPRELFPETEIDPAGQEIGAYRVVREIGRGGLGTVYLAERADESYRKEVALKLVRRGLDTEDILQRFRHERQILAQLEHPYIARLLDGGTTKEGLPYFVMEYVQGETLTKFCDGQGMDVEGRLQLFRKVCAAVSYAHQNLVIHRDLKPSNILVTADGTPKLLDFGIAKVLTPEEDALTQTIPSQRVMTPEYASPEQIKGGRITTSSDVYSLGVLLYELLTGQKPYRLTKPSAEELSRAITDQEPERPSTAVVRQSDNQKLPLGHQQSLKGDLDNIVLMALRKEPERRYPSVERFSEDIRCHLEGRPVTAHKDTVSYRAGKFIRRNKAAVTAAALVALTVVVGIAAVLRQSQIAREQRDHAEAAQATATRLNQFLQSLLSSANPDAMGRDVKVVQVLDDASARLDRELGSEPALLAQAHLTIARAYAQLRAAEPAERHARAALALDRKLFGDNHPATAEVMAFVGRTMQIFRRYKEAEPLLRQALAVQRREPPADRNQFARTLQVLGTVLINTGRAQEAAPLVAESLALSRELNGEKSVQVADALQTTGVLRQALGDRPGAMEAWRASLAIHRQLVPRQLTFLDPLADLSEMLFSEGKVDEAAALLEEGDRFARQSIGQDNPTYGALLGRLALIDFVRQQYSAAIPRLERCLATVGQVYPKETPEMVLAKTVLGLSLTRSGRAAEAEPLLRAALVEGKAVPAARLALIGNLEGALGECLLAEKNFSEAEPLLRLSHEKLSARLGAENPQTTAALHRWEQARAEKDEG
ncbi:MAG: protein kinase [Spartobacteria bacterium]